jgi:hypothetical protein
MSLRAVSAGAKHATFRGRTLYKKSRQRLRPSRSTIYKSDGAAKNPFYSVMAFFTTRTHDKHAFTPEKPQALQDEFFAWTSRFSQTPQSNQ